MGERQSSLLLDVSGGCVGFETKDFVVIDACVGEEDSGGVEETYSRAE